MTMEQYLKKLKRARAMFPVISIVLISLIVVGVISFIASPMMMGATLFMKIGVFGFGAVAMSVAVVLADKITESIFFPKQSPSEAMPEVEVNGD